MASQFEHVPTAFATLSESAFQIIVDDTDEAKRKAQQFLVRMNHFIESQCQPVHDALQNVLQAKGEASAIMVEAALKCDNKGMRQWVIDTLNHPLPRGAPLFQ